jgi:hypothetical protein
MKRYIFYFAVILAAGSGLRCKPEEKPNPASDTATMIIEVQPEVNGQPFVLNKRVQGSDNLKFDMSIFRAYLSNIRLVKEDNTEQNVQPIVLIDLGQPGSTAGDPNTVGTKFTIKVPVGNYKGINMGIGVPKELNVVKQNYPNTHPLSTYRGMSWDWAGYRFVMMEGTTGDNNVGFSYHIFTDTFYREVNFSNAVSFSGDETKTLKLTMDMNKIFNPVNTANKVDPATEPNAHSGTPEEMDIARRLMDNLVSAITLQ